MPATNGGDGERREKETVVGDRNTKLWWTMHW